VIAGTGGNFLGILAKSLPVAAKFPAAISGVFYILAGISLLITRKKWGAILSIIFIALEILGRAYLVTSGLFPMNRTNILAVATGTAIALIVIFYVVAKWQSFD
jgi:uncharacterized membrane protein